MGLVKKTTSFRVSPETAQELGEIQAGLSPLAEDSSSTLRVIIHWVWSMFHFVLTGEVTDSLRKFQRLLGITLHCAPQPPAGEGQR